MNEKPGTSGIPGMFGTTGISGVADMAGLASVAGIAGATGIIPVGTPEGIVASAGIPDRVSVP
jgi:hypothetical protein